MQTLLRLRVHPGPAIARLIIMTETQTATQLVVALEAAGASEEGEAAEEAAAVDIPSPALDRK